jgi:hypothetical protein
VAAADGVDPADLDALDEYVDPEIPDKPDDHDRGPWRFTFRFSDHQVTVTHDREILVDGVTATADVAANEYFE